jgi:hypothetical protein
MGDHHYRAPGFLSRRLLNPVVAALAERGAPVGGAVVLAVPGRVTGQVRTVPLTPVTIDGRRYLISPRGETDWVRNLRAAGGIGALRTGGEPERVRAVEQGVEAAVPVLQAYVRGLGRGAGLLFDDITAGSTETEVAAAAPRHPVFELTAAA